VRQPVEVGHHPQPHLRIRQAGPGQCVAQTLRDDVGFDRVAAAWRASSDDVDVSCR